LTRAPVGYPGKGLHMEWHYKVLDVVVLKGVIAVRRASQLRWTSHIQRMLDCGIILIFYGKLSCRRRKRR